MKILVIPDKFKGCLSSSEAIFHIIKGCKKSLPDADFTAIPFSDGGEGSLESIAKAVECATVACASVDALGRPVKATYLRHGFTAYIETSRSCGLMLLEQSDRNPMNTSTFGVGMIIRHAIHTGCTRIHLFLGGSATHDGGTGMAAALGFTFTNKEGQLLQPKGSNLSFISQISRKTEGINLSHISFNAWSDVRVPLRGLNGAILFASQKGAREEDLPILQQGTDHLSTLYQQVLTGQDAGSISGSGAAGGLGAGCIVFLGAVPGSGWDFFSGLHQLERQIREADLVITGEGKLDDQTLKGKCVGGIAQACKRLEKPCLVFCGISELSPGALEELGAPVIYPLSETGESPNESMKMAGFRLEKKVSEAIDWHLQRDVK